MIANARHAPRAVVILAAGKGTRMKSAMPKVLHAIAGLPMIEHVLQTARSVEASRIVVVLSPEMREVEYHLKKRFPDIATCIQPEQKGTGDAVKAARKALAGHDGPVAVLYGDTPLITPETVNSLFTILEDDPKTAVTLLGMYPLEPGGYGRIITSSDGRVESIVEVKDAAPEQLDVPLCNAGVMAICGDRLFALLDRLSNSNASGEYYLTDVVGLANADGQACKLVIAEETEVMGINTRAELAEAEYQIQQRLRNRALEAGVTMTDPETVYFAWDTELSRDVVIEPNVFFGPGVRIESGVEIRAFSHIEGAHVASGATIGPFARLRPDTRIGTEARIGNFVEIKKASIGHRAKVNHLSYIGDAEVGKGSNIGAGTITCNYDGYMKHHTHIGEGVFIGSNSALVAPLSIGDGAFVGAGSVITEDVEPDALDIARPPQKSIKNWAKRYRMRKLS